MTDKEKLEKIMSLADNMYTSMQNLTTDTTRIRKAMYEYHQFIIQHCNNEEPVSEDLEEFATKLANEYFPDESNIWARPNHEARFLYDACVRTAQWQKEQMMKDAIEAVINSKENDLILYQSLPAFITKNGWHKGDKVKLNIVKEAEK